MAARRARAPPARPSPPTPSSKRSPRARGGDGRRAARPMTARPMTRRGGGWRRGGGRGRRGRGRGPGGDVRDRPRSGPLALFAGPFPLWHLFPRRRPPATSTPHDPVDRRAERHTATPVVHILGMVDRLLGPWVVDCVGRGRVWVPGWSMEGARAGRDRAAVVVQAARGSLTGLPHQGTHIPGGRGWPASGTVPPSIDRWTPWTR